MKVTLSQATIAKLQLGRDDIVVIRSKHQLTQEQVEHLKTQLHEIIGNHEIVVLPPELSLSVVAKQAT